MKNHELRMIKMCTKTIKMIKPEKFIQEVQNLFVSVVFFHCYHHYH